MVHNYVCDSCSKEYVEIRDPAHEQIVTVCDVCGGTFVTADK